MSKMCITPGKSPATKQTKVNEVHNVKKKRLFSSGDEEKSHLAGDSSKVERRDLAESDMHHLPKVVEACTVHHNRLTT